MSWTITGAEKTSVDPLFNNVSLLLHGDLVTTPTNIVDSSPTPKIVTAVGNAQISTAVADPFGNSTRGVLAFDGSGDWLQVPSSTIQFATGDFTIELWVYRNNSVNAGIYETRPGASTTPFAWYFLSNNLAFFDGSTNFQTTSTVPTSQWVHIAITRSSGVLRQFVNGVKGSEHAVTLDLTNNNLILIGRLRDSGTEFNGYIDDLRITKGIARYTANFTPPTAPFPDI